MCTSRLSSDATSGFDFLITATRVLPERWCIVRSIRSRAVSLATFSRFVIERSSRLTRGGAVVVAPHQPRERVGGAVEGAQAAASRSGRRPASLPAARTSLATGLRRLVRRRQSRDRNRRRSAPRARRARRARAAAGSVLSMRSRSFVGVASAFFESRFFFAGEGGAADPLEERRRASLLEEPPIAVHPRAARRRPKIASFARRETTGREGPVAARVTFGDVSV